MDWSSTRRSKLDLRRRPLYWAVQGGSVQYQAVHCGLARLTPLQLVGTMLDRRSSRIGSQTLSAIRNAESAGNRDMLWYLAVQGGSVQYQAVQSAPSTSTWVPGGPRWIGPVPSGPEWTCDVDIFTGRSKGDRPSTLRSREDLGGRHPGLSGPTRGPLQWWTVRNGLCPKLDLRPGESGLVIGTRSGRDVG